MKQQAIDILEKIRHEIDRNKTQKFLQGNISKNKFEIESGKCEVLYRAISELQALGDGWIESSTKPKEGFYLTYNTIGAIFETYYHPHTGWCTGGSIKETEITHYQPLINPPNK